MPPLEVELELQAARPAVARAAAASPAAARRVVLRDLRVLRIVMMFVPSAVRVLRTAARPGAPVSLGYRPPGEGPGRHRQPSGARSDVRRLPATMRRPT